MANSSRPTADRVGGQRGQPVAAEDEAPGADQAGHADAGGEELEDDQRQADHEQQVGHRRAGHGVQELAAERELGEAGLGDGLALAVVAVARRPRLSHAVEAVARTRRWWARRCRPGPRSTASPALTLSPTAASPSRRAVAEERRGDLDAAARAPRRRCGRRRAARWPRRWPGCPTGPTHTSTGTSSVSMRSTSASRRSSSTTAPPLLSCSTRAMAPVVLGLGRSGSRRSRPAPGRAAR